MIAPVTLKSLTSADLSLNDLASIAADALAAINAKQQAWRDNARRGGYAKHFVSCPQVNDELHLALLSEIVDFDQDPRESLLTLEMEAERSRAVDAAEYRAELIRDQQMMDAWGQRA